ncbi:MAG: peptidoglycan-binding domain-containing protein [Bradyrhizobium sp.]
MPRKAARDDDDRPRRRRGARAAAVEAERGLAMRILLHSPKDTVAGLLAFAAVSAILANALFLQSGHHPAPMFGSVVVMPQPGPVSANLLPRPRPLDADVSEARVVEPRAAEPKAAEKPYELRFADPVGNLVKATVAAPATTASVLRPPAPIPASTRAELTGPRRVAAVQRVLTEYGYGQLKPTGTAGTDTQAAIAKFERERKLPVTGQVSDRLVRELAAVIGHPVD